MEKYKRDKNIGQTLEEQTKKEVKRKYKRQKTRNMKSGSEAVEPRRKRGVTETPDLNVVIGYNVYPEGVKNLQGSIPRIVINAEPLPDAESIERYGLPGFEAVNECKRVIFRRVPGNDFFYELIKCNVTHERIFLVCEPTDGTKISNLSGRNFNILFVGREGKELLAIRPSPNTKETVSVIYKDQELGRIIRHNLGDSTTSDSPSHTILDRDLNRIFILRKKVQVISSKKCCFNKGNRTVDNGYNVFAVKTSRTATEKIEEETCVACICASETEVKFTPFEEQLGIIEKSLLFAALVSINTKAMESAGLGFRLSLSF